MARMLAAVGVVAISTEAKTYSAAELRRYGEKDCKGKYTVVGGDKMDECTPYLIPEPASILVNQTDETHYSSYHFNHNTDCTGGGRRLVTMTIGDCENYDTFSQMRAWVDAPKPPKSACTVP